MKPGLRLLLPALLLLPTTLSAQVPADKAVGTLKVVEGLEASLWASEPLFVNPTCFDVDHKGRVWVCESVNYRNKLHRKPKLNRPEGDRIVILEDTKQTGRADKATTFYQSPELLAPLGIAVAPDPNGPGCKVFVCQSPDILVFEDRDGDGKADGPPKKLLSGFGGYDHDHGVHGILIGPDRKLYFSVGDTGVHGLQGADKKGRVWHSNSTDCRAGTIWRCEMDGSKLELIAHNFRNEYEPAVDSFGNVFVSDNDDDGNQQTRICFVMPGGNYGYHPRGRGETHWHEEQPGVVPKILRTYFGSPTGMCIYEGKLLPQKYRGQPLHTDAGPRQVRCYHLTPEGAGFAVEREDMVQSSDNWFRPSDVCVGPDGSVFVADWYDPGVGGHGMGDTTRGRIFRLIPKGSKPAVPGVDLEKKDGFLAALGSPNLAVRSRAMAKLQGLKKDEALAILRPALEQKEEPVLRARALWQVGVLGLQKHHFFGKVLSDSDPRFRTLALRILKGCYGISPADLGPEAQKQLVSDPDAGVRREALLMLRDADPERCRDLLFKLAKTYDGKDRFYLAAVGIAVGHHDEARRKVLLADFEKHFPQWNESVAGLVWELQPPRVLPLVEKRLYDAKLPAEQRAKIVDILAASQDKGAGAAVLKLLHEDVPAEVRDRAFENLKLFLPGKWQSLKGSADFDRTVKALLAKGETRPRGLALLALSGKAEALKDVLAIAANEKEALAIRKEAVKTLGQFQVDAAADGLAGILKSGPVELKPDAVGALATLAKEAARAGSGKALGALQGLVRDAKVNLDLRKDAVDGLAEGRAGSEWLLSLNAEGKLPAELREEAGRALRNSVYIDLRNKALVAFPAAGKIDPKKLPSIAKLATRRGNAGHGQKILAESLKGNPQCLKCHMVRGQGGQIGPDLSMIGKKASRENLFESILFPSKAVADQYVTWQIETSRGLTLAGLIVEETPAQVVLRNADGKDTVIPAKEIESRSKSPKSLMPDDLAAFLSEEDLVDLVEYLLTLKTPALAPDSWHIAGPFDNIGGMEGLDKVYPPEKKIDFADTYEGKGGKVRWRTVRPGATGYVDLQGFYAPASNQVVSYLVRDIESPADQEATVLLGTDDGAKLWVNGALVHTAKVTRAAAPEQDRVAVKLKKGSNRVVLKVNNGDGGHGFYFTLLSEQELKLAGKK